METVPAALRPHAKIHKSPVLGQMQIDAGAIGLTTATVWEATAMIEAGIGDIFDRQPGRRRSQGRRAGAAGHDRQPDRRCRRRRERRADLQRGGRGRGRGRGPGRDRRRPPPRRRARRRARGRAGRAASSGLPGLRLRGPFGYEGHCMLEPDREERVRKAKAANAELLGARRRDRSGAGCRPRSSPPAGSAPGTSPAPTRGSPRSTPAPTSSPTPSTAISCPASTRR